MKIIDKFNNIDADLSSIGLRRAEFPSYFCTPLNAVIFANLGVDGIHFCILPSKEDSTLENSPVYIVSPCMPEHYVEPIAASFAEFLSLVVTIKDAGAMECISYITKEAFYSYLKDIPVEKEEIIKVVNAIRENFVLEDIPNVYDYVKNIQQDLRFRRIKFSKEYYAMTGDKELI